MPPASPEQARWFNEEVKPHEPVLRGYLLKRFPSVPDHDDIVQETFARLLRAAREGAIVRTRGFLFTVARNLAIDTLRRRRKFDHEEFSDLQELSILDHHAGIAESLEQRQKHDALFEAIASLPDRCREVVTMRHVDGLPYREIAARLAISEHTVRLHLVKGVRRCAEYFERQGLLDDPPEGRGAP